MPGSLGGNKRGDEKLIVRGDVPINIGNGATKWFASVGAFEEDMWLERCYYHNAETAGTPAATVTAQVKKVASIAALEARTGTAMGAATAPSLTNAVSAKEIDVYREGDSGTEYPIGGGIKVDSRAILRKGEYLVTEVVTSGGAGENPKGMVEYHLRPYFGSLT